MDSQEKVARFNRENRPFVMNSCGDGKYGMSLNFSSQIGAYRNYGREAFDRYTVACGESVKTREGLYRHGNGYDWEIVFKKVFEHERRLQEIEFDSEAGGFFCHSQNLDLLLEFGTRFRHVCENKEQFAKVVSTALSEKERQDEYDFEHKTLRFHLQDCSRCSLEIETPGRHLYIGGGKIKRLLRGCDIEVYDMIAETVCQMEAKDLLRLSIGEREDDWEHFHVRLKSNDEIEEHLKPEMVL